MRDRRSKYDAEASNSRAVCSTVWFALEVHERLPIERRGARRAAEAGRVEVLGAGVDPAVAHADRAAARVALWREERLEVRSAEGAAVLHVERGARADRASARRAPEAPAVPRATHRLHRSLEHHLPAAPAARRPEARIALLAEQAALFLHKAEFHQVRAALAVLAVEVLRTVALVKRTHERAADALSAHAADGHHTDRRVQSFHRVQHCLPAAPLSQPFARRRSDVPARPVAHGGPTGRSGHSRPRRRRRVALGHSSGETGDRRRLPRNTPAHASSNAEASRTDPRVGPRRRRRWCRLVRAAGHTRGGAMPTSWLRQVLRRRHASAAARVARHGVVRVVTRLLRAGRARRAVVGPRGSGCRYR